MIYLYIKIMDSKSLYSKTPIIIDIGTSSIKAGLSGQEKPSLIFPNYFDDLSAQGKMMIKNIFR